jgi:hypothetical protein
LLKEALIEDLKQNPAEQFQCIFIAVQSRQQGEIYNHCFEKWSAKTHEESTASSTIPDQATGNKEQKETKEQVVIVQQPRVDEVTLANWLKPSSDDDDFFETWVTRNPEDVEIPWQQCPEVIMDYSPALGNAIIF